MQSTRLAEWHVDGEFKALGSRAQRYGHSQGSLHHHSSSGNTVICAPPFKDHHLQHLVPLPFSTPKCRRPYPVPSQTALLLFVAKIPGTWPGRIVP